MGWIWPVYQRFAFSELVSQSLQGLTLQEPGRVLCVVAPSDSGTASGGVTWVGMESEWVKEAKVILYPHLMGSLLPHPLLVVLI